MRLTLLGVLAAALSLPAAAQDPKPDIDAATAAIKAHLPSTQITSVKASPVDGLYEVVMGRNVVYLSGNGRYMVAGHIYDIETQKDLTADRAEAVSRIDWTKLPLDKAVRIVRGNGARKLAVFSDPDCPYCKKLEPELEQVSNTTVYLFLLPIAQLHPDAASKAVSVWCAKDRANTWRDLMLAGKVPAKVSCTNPLADIEALAQSLGIRGTPYLISEDGRMLPGAANAARIDAWLSGQPAVK